MTTKNEALYLHLFNLRQMIHSIMEYDKCWSLQYAVKLNMITHLNVFMDQLYQQENLTPVDIIFEGDTITTKPTLLDIVNLKGQVRSVCQFLKDLSVLDNNFKVVSDTLNGLISHIDYFKSEIPSY